MITTSLTSRAVSPGQIWHVYRNTDEVETLNKIRYNTECNKSSRFYLILFMTNSVAFCAPIYDTSTNGKFGEVQTCKGDLRLPINGTPRYSMSPSPLDETSPCIDVENIEKFSIFRFTSTSKCFLHETLSAKSMQTILAAFIATMFHNDYNKDTFMDIVYEAFTSIRPQLEDNYNNTARPVELMDYGVSYASISAVTPRNSDPYQLPSITSKEAREVINTKTDKESPELCPQIPVQDKDSSLCRGMTAPTTILVDTTAPEKDTTPVSTNKLSKPQMYQWDELDPILIDLLAKYTIKEAANILNIPASTVSTHIKTPGYIAKLNK